MRIVVTGGNGRIGRPLTEMAAADGHEVLSLDRALPDVMPGGVRAGVCDVTNMGEVMDLFTGFGPDAVVHLAAWVHAGIVADHRTYAENVAGSFNVLSAAARAKAQRAIFGSSAQVYGFAGRGPAALPVTEDHPRRPQNAYALSKIAGEATASYITNESSTKVLSFRIMGARTASQMAGEIDVIGREPANGQSLLWTRVDVRDVAAACLAALTTQEAPPGPYNITGTSILIPGNTRDLIACYCPHLDPAEAPEGTASPMSCAKAADAFGYAPRHTLPTAIV